MILLKLFIIAFIIFWLILGVVMVIRWNDLFGPHADDPSESPGSRSLSVAHIGAVWVGGLALAIYFLF